jgi:hypothetical protein
MHNAAAQLATRYKTLVAEEPNATGMPARTHSAGAAPAQRVGKAPRQHGCKTPWNGGELVITDRPG